MSWSIGDSEGKDKSSGSVEPERISEVVSDVVESESGYIDAGFDVPTGGAFRVMDVIVAQAPRFDPESNRLPEMESVTGLINLLKCHTSRSYLVLPLALQSRTSPTINCIINLR